MVAFLSSLIAGLVIFVMAWLLIVRPLEELARDIDLFAERAKALADYLDLYPTPIPGDTR